MDDLQQPSSIDEFRPAFENNQEEEYVPPNDNRKLIIILSILALMGIIFGGTGFYYAKKANDAIYNLQISIELEKDRALNEVNTYEQFDKSIQRLKADNELLKKSALKTSTNNKKILNKFVTVVESNRKLINILANNTGISFSHHNGEKNSKSKKPKKTNSDKKDIVTDNLKPRFDYHIIQSGDTFSKLAQKYQKSTQAFMEANPDIDPQRLQIGQKIKIPNS